MNAFWVVGHRYPSGYIGTGWPPVKDIEQRARMLFGPLKRPVEKPLVFKRASIKALTANKQASTVAA